MVGMEPTGFYFYITINKLTMTEMFQVFGIKAKFVPKPLQDSGFPNGLTVGASFPKGNH